MSRRAGVAASLFVTSALAACGDNLGPGFEPWVLEPLAASDGFWVRTPEFEVAAGAEIQDCYFFQVPAGATDLMVDRLTMALNPGSHHMNVFRVNTVRNLGPTDGAPVDLGGVQGRFVAGGAPGTGECWKAGNWSDWPLVANSQQSTPGQPILDWNLPDDVATRFAPGQWLMLQVHFVNATTQETPFRGRGGVNFHLSKDGDRQELGTLFATQQSIRICRSNPLQTYSGSCSMANGAHTIAAANGHFHSRGKRFSMYAWDGQSTERPADAARFYQSARWAEPDMATDLNVAVPDGGGIWWTCEFEWREPVEGCAAVDARDPLQAGDCCFTFGPTVESSEHCNAFAYYYPKSEDVNCF